MIKYLFTVLTTLLIVQNASATWQNGSVEFIGSNVNNDKIAASKTKKNKNLTNRAGIGIITGVSVSAIKANHVTVSYPYTAFNYFDNSIHSYHAIQHASMNASSSNTQYLLGGGIDYATKAHVYVECEGELIAPFSGNKITAVNFGGGGCVRPARNNIELRVGANFFYLSRKARLGEINNHNQDVKIGTYTFSREYYVERKKDSVIVYDLYDATRIDVYHEEYYTGIQPKFMVDFEDRNSTAFFRIHMGWNLPFLHDKNIDFEQRGSRSATVSKRPVQYNTKGSLTIDTANPLVHYTTDHQGPTFTTGMFVKVEVGIKLHE